MATYENRYSKNLPGRYYVDDTCIDCDLCRELAPAHFKRDDDLGQSFVCRQPATAEELRMCEEAVEMCPTNSIGNDGPEAG